jgi:hypothetical protein
VAAERICANISERDSAHRNLRLDTALLEKVIEGTRTRGITFTIAHP